LQSPGGSTTTTEQVEGYWLRSGQLQLHRRGVYTPQRKKS
jgi:hypothetical protein